MMEGGGSPGEPRELTAQGLRSEAGEPSAGAMTPGSSNGQDMRLWTVESGFESLPRNVGCFAHKGAVSEEPPTKTMDRWSGTIFHVLAPSSRGQGRCPLTAETRVRISVGPSFTPTTPARRPHPEFPPKATQRPAHRPDLSPAIRHLPVAPLRTLPFVHHLLSTLALLDSQRPAR